MLFPKQKAARWRGRPLLRIMLPVSGCFSVYVALRHRGEFAVRQLFLIEVLLQDGRAVVAAKHFRPCDERAVTRNFLCLDRCPRPKQIDNRPHNEPDKISHY